MANSFTIEVKGLDQVEKILKDLPKRATDEINAEFQLIGKEWQEAAFRDAPADRARLKGSISDKNGSLSFELQAQTAYAAYQEFGTKGQFRAPASVPGYASQFKGGGNNGGVNPIVALTAWVERKGIAQGKKAKSVAFLIFRKQKRVGMPAKSFLFTGRDGSDRVKFFVEKLRKNIAAVLKDII